MKESDDTVIIDMMQIYKKLRSRSRLFFLTLSIVFVLSCIYIVSVPRYYASDTKLAPETESASKGGTLGNIASTLGIDLSQINSSDAITPLLYPNLIDDDKFITQLFTIPVKTLDGKLETTYYNYLALYQKHPWWENILFHLFKGHQSKKMGSVNPYQLSKKQNKIAEKIRENVKLSVDSKNGVLTITTQSQDPLVSKTIADSVRVCLQTFITNYRTNKANHDFVYYKKIALEAQKDYRQAQKAYSSFADANTDIILPSIRSKMEDLENDMQLKYNTYTSLNAQLQSAKAKVQERTPAFTILKGAAVPLKPAGPKRMIFVAVMLLVAFCIQSIWILKKDILEIFK